MYSGMSAALGGAGLAFGHVTVVKRRESSWLHVLCIAKLSALFERAVEDVKADGCHRASQLGAGISRIQDLFLDTDASLRHHMMSMAN